MLSAFGEPSHIHQAIRRTISDHRRAAPMSDRTTFVGVTPHVTRDVTRDSQNQCAGGGPK